MSSLRALSRASRSVLLTVLFPGFLGLSAVGCVPYSVHQQTKEELIKAKDANADLIKKYNSAVQQLMALKERGGEGVVPANYKELQDEVARLRAEAARNVRPGFSPKDIEGVGGGATDEGGGLALGEALLFAEGSAELKRQAYSTLDKIVGLLVGEHASEPFVIEGHTDNQPVVRTVKLYGDNVTLGYARAHAVYQYFRDKGIPESRMTIHTYAYNKPVSEPDKVNSSDGRAQNRRVVVRLGTTTI